MRKFLGICLAMTLAGCVTRVTPSDILQHAPPPINLVIQQIDAEPACATPRPMGRPDPNKPRMFFQCTATFPPILAEAGIEGSCRTMFDVNDAGVPEALETRCVVYDRYAPASKEWLDLAKQAYEYAARTAVSNNRYAPMDPSDKYANIQLDRTNFSQADIFVMAGSKPCLDEPAKFMRPPPAPVPPPFVIVPPGPGCPVR